MYIVVSLDTVYWNIYDAWTIALAFENNLQKSIVVTFSSGAE